MYGLTRKDGNNRTRLGITSYVVGFLFVLGVTFYLTSKAAKREVVLNSDRRAEVAVEHTKQSLNRWDRIAVDSSITEQQTSVRRNLKEQKVTETPKSSQAVLDMQSVSTTELQTSAMMEYKPQLADQSQGLETMLSQTKVAEVAAAPAPIPYKLERADSGRAYLRSRNGVFSAAADEGTQLLDAAGNTLVVGDSGTLYTEGANGVKTPLTTVTTSTVRDLKFRYYRVDPKTQQMAVITPGGPGSFKGPDGASYYITKEGNIEKQEDGQRTTAQIGGQGEFTGTDGQTYIMSDGALYTKSNATVSFGQENMTGIGHFRDPAGQLLLRGEDGVIYSYGADQNPRRASVTGVGSFSGPDGAMYRRDSAGNITRLVAAQSTSAHPVINVSGPSTPTGLSGTSQFSSNALQFQRNGKAGEFVPEAVAGELKGGMVYHSDGTAARKGKAATPAQPEADSAEAASKPEKPYNFLPIGQNIPFFITTKVTTQFQSPGVIEAQVAENVYFHDAVLPAGSRLYGRLGLVGKNNRVNIIFTTLVYTTGQELALAGDTYDVNFDFGLGAYLKPVPAWVKGLRYAQIPVLQKLALSQNASSASGNIGTLNSTPSPASQYAVDLIKRTQEELEVENASYVVVAPGTAGILKLTNKLVLTPSDDASQRPAAPAPSLEQPSTASVTTYLGSRGAVSTGAQATGAVNAAVSPREEAPAPATSQDEASVNEVFGPPKK